MVVLIVNRIISVVSNRTGEEKGEAQSQIEWREEGNNPTERWMRDDAHHRPHNVKVLFSITIAVYELDALEETLTETAMSHVR